MISDIRYTFLAWILVIYKIPLLLEKGYHGNAHKERKKERTAESRFLQTSSHPPPFFSLSIKGRKMR